MSTDEQTEVRSTVEALSTERALKLARQLISNLRTHSWTTSDEQFVLKAIDEALAEQPAQQQEPVVWMYVNKSTHETKFQKHMRDFVDHSLWSEVPLYGEPLANHELQCVCGAVWLGDEMVHLPNKHPPASKPWVGLTDQEFQWIYDNGRTPAGMMELTEAKLREKNA